MRDDRNGSGYYDPTAYKAIRNVDRELKKKEKKIKLKNGVTNKKNNYKYMEER